MEPLIVAPEVRTVLEQRGIRDEDLRGVIDAAEEEGSYHLEKATGHRLAARRTDQVTFWVEYTPEGEGFRIHRAYSHRMKIIEGFNLPAKTPNTNASWYCARCDRLLETATVKLTYLDETFAADTPACPSCQRVMVGEEDAVTRMALAEKMLEDK